MSGIVDRIAGHLGMRVPQTSRTPVVDHRGKLVGYRTVTLTPPGALPPQTDGRRRRERRADRRR